MVIKSFDKNVVIIEPEAIERLVELLLSNEVRPINRKFASEAMARGKRLLKRCLSQSKRY